MQDNTLHICILITGGPLEGTETYDTYGNEYYGEYHFTLQLQFHIYILLGDLARSWLKKGAQRPIEFEYYDVRKNEFPDLEKHFDIYLITGSPNGVYEDIQWIRDLEHLIRELDARKRCIIGICFGHQVVVKALGGDVQKNSKGWEVSTCPFELSDEGKQVFKGKDVINLIYSHQDTVVKLPESLINLGGNKLTYCQGVIKDKHILTFQGHPEFDATVMKPLLDRVYSQAGINEQEYNDSVERLSLGNDNDYLATSTFEFFGLL